MINVTTTRAAVIGADAHLHMTGGELAQLLQVLSSPEPAADSWRAGLCRRLRAALLGCVCERHEHIPGGPEGGCNAVLVPSYLRCACTFAGSLT